MTNKQTATIQQTPEFLQMVEENRKLLRKFMYCGALVGGLIGLIWSIGIKNSDLQPLAFISCSYPCPIIVSVLVGVLIGAWIGFNTSLDY